MVVGRPHEMGMVVLHRIRSVRNWVGEKRARWVRSRIGNGDSLVDVDGFGDESATRGSHRIQNSLMRVVVVVRLWWWVWRSSTCGEGLSYVHLLWMREWRYGSCCW